LRKKDMIKRYALLPLLLVNSPAVAHIGAEGGHSHFMAGFIHPVSGLDHFAAMIAVGLVASFMGGKARLALPSAFLLTMLAGGLLAMTKLVVIPAFEAMILASVIGLGMALLSAKRLPLTVAVAFSAMFGLAHGFAHGVEGVFTPNYVLGFLLATSLLHGIGLAIGHLFSTINRLPLYRISGGGLVLVGLALANL
jgi:urease accessory protein